MNAYRQKLEAADTIYLATSDPHGHSAREYLVNSMGGYDADAYRAAITAGALSQLVDDEWCDSWTRGDGVYLTEAEASAYAAEQRDAREGVWRVLALTRADVRRALVAGFGDGLDARLRALEEHREGTQFRPLDPGSPTVLLQVRVPQALLGRVDAAAEAAGVSRSEWVRAALEERLGD